MQPNPACKTVKGLSIATIVLSALSLVLCVVVGTCMAFAANVVNNNADTIISETMAVLETDSISNGAITINNHDVDIDAVVSAMRMMGNKDVDIVAAALEEVGAGHYLSAFELLGSADASQLIAAKNVLANLSDVELQAIANSVDGLTVGDLEELRSAARGVNNDDIALACSYLKNREPEAVVSDLVDVTMLIMGLLVLFVALSNIVTLVAGILGVRNAFNPSRLGAAFVWSIVGAVFAFLLGGWIRMVVLIINAVYINKVRKAPQIPMPGYPPYPGAGPGGPGQGGYYPPSSAPTQSLHYPNALH